MCIIVFIDLCLISRLDLKILWPKCAKIKGNQYRHYVKSAKTKKKQTSERFNPKDKLIVFVSLYPSTMPIFSLSRYRYHHCSIINWRLLLVFIYHYFSLFASQLHFHHYFLLTIIGQHYSKLSRTGYTTPQKTGYFTFPFTVKMLHLVGRYHFC